MDELLSPDLSIGEVKALQTPLAFDLVAAYTQMRNDALDLVNRAKRESWTPEQLIDAMRIMLGAE